MAMRPILLTLLCVLIGTPPLQAKKECIPWEKVYAKAMVEKVLPTSTLVSIQPFKNGTEKSGDAWLEIGLADLLRRYLAVNEWISPFLSTTLQHVSNPNIAFQVTGLFQHLPGSLRAFIQLKDPQGKLITQVPLEIPFPHHTRFFIGMREVAEKILPQVGTKKINQKGMLEIQNQTANVLAYENYIKGMNALQSYDPNKMEVALIWFQEALREDRRYVQPYLGLMESFGFVSLYHKQRGEPYNQDLENIGNTLKTMVQWIPRARATHNRYLNAHVHFLAGARALSQGEASKAVSKLSAAWAEVPEDPSTIYHLALSYDKMGKPEEAARFWQQLKEIDRCFKK